MTEHTVKSFPEQLETLSAAGAGDPATIDAFRDHGVVRGTTITEVRAVSMDRDALRSWIQDRPEIAAQQHQGYPDLAPLDLGQPVQVLRAIDAVQEAFGGGHEVLVKMKSVICSSSGAPCGAEPDRVALAAA